MAGGVAGTAGCDAVAIGDADHSWLIVCIVAGGDWCLAVTVVVAGTGVGDGCEVSIEVNRRFRWATGKCGCRTN